SSPCDILNSPFAFYNGLATNVGGSKKPVTGRSDGWHFAKAAGLPNREITGIAIDPKNPRTVYVTLAGYDRPWTDKGLGNQHGFGRGHVFKSTDAGQHFKNISKNLPNTDVWDVKLSGKRIVVGTDVGVFLSTGKSWSRLGTGLPNVWARSLAFKPNDSNLLIAAAYGRGVWAYRFGPPHKVSSGPKPVALHPAAATGAKIASFNFDTSAQGWTQTTNSAEQWRRQPPGDGSPFAFAVIPYIDASSAALTSPKLSVPKPSRGYNAQPITVTFSRLQSTEPGFDYLTVEWSSDGVRWTPAASGWSGMNPDFPQFSKTTVKFVAPAGALYIRFHLSSDELVSFPAYQGAAVDNVTVTR
ncbi:MAG TPA: hypothetical protein VF972_02005, partial [Actinomycetota bacterium]